MLKFGIYVIPVPQPIAYMKFSIKFNFALQSIFSELADTFGIAIRDALMLLTLSKMQIKFAKL